MSKCVVFIVLTLYLAQLVHSKHTDYLDLLHVSDNEEFQWGAEQNQQQDQSNGSIGDFLTAHRLNKRQANFGSSAPLLENRDFGACRTALGDVGRCRHIVYCRMPELKNDVWRLVSQLCIIEKTSIGICCTDTITTTRFSPQFITNDVESPRIVNNPQQAEQRGCGITTRQFPRITGGRPAEPDEWPWMAALMRPGLPYVWCGGVLITDRHVLTAAHCVHKLSKNDIFVRLGEYNTGQQNETRARDFRVGSMVLHLDYDSLTYTNDIALLRIDRPTLFNTYIWPICMPPLNEDWTGRNGIVTGWGTQKFGGPYSSILMEVNLPIWKHTDCQNAMVEHIPDTVICAGVPEGGQDSCQGDSGGPLLVQLPNMRWVTIGIVSWGLRCGEANRPGMYTRVDRYLDWILSNADI